MANETTNGMRVKLSSNDSFDEDTLSDDVDDEVFIKSARNGFRGSNKDKTLQKPLMAPRKKSERDRKSGIQFGRSNGSHLMEIHTASPKGSSVLLTVLYVIVALSAITGLTVLVIFLGKSQLPGLMQKVGMWKTLTGIPLPEPCESFVEEAVWEANLPHTISQGQKVLALTDLNGDNISDIILGFDSGLVGVTPLTSFLCQLYFNTSSTICDGGLFAINGSNGAVVWTTWLEDAVVAVKCEADFDLDGIKDCIAVGKSRALWAVSSKEGKLLWGIATDKLQLSCLADSVFRSAQLTEDLSGDKIPDIVVGIKGSRSKCPDYLAVINGYTGNVIQLTGTADQRSLSVGPVLKGSGDGSTYVLYSTNGINGSLFMASLRDLASGRKDLVRTVLNNITRIGEIAVSDITGDGMEDFIVTMDNGTLPSDGKDVVALSGTRFECLWIHSIPAGTSVKIQALANLNHDQIPDVAIQITQAMNGTNATWIRVLDGSNGRPLMNTPSRPRRWDVHGESLPIDGPGADVFVDWIADDEDETNKRRVNRLMGFTAHGELPALVVYTTPNSPPSRPTGYGPETSLHDVLDAVSQDESLRAKFSNYIRHTESEHGMESEQISEELEPASVGYPVQHGVRKHGRWNGRPRHESYQPSAYDYDSGDLLLPVPAADEAPPRYRKTQRPVWKSAPVVVADEDAAYGSSANDYTPDDTSGSDYELDNRDYRDRSGRFAAAAAARSGRPDLEDQPAAAVPWRLDRNGGRRGKRIRRQATQMSLLADQPAESIRFPPMAVESGIKDDVALDIVFGVQWSWSEPEEKPEQLRSLSDCVSRRLDQAGLGDDSVVDLAAECSQSLLLQGQTSPKSADNAKSGPGSSELKLIASAVDHWLRPLARRLHGWVSLKRVRLRCHCQAVAKSVGRKTPRPCANLRPLRQRRKIDFNYGW